MSEDFQIAFGDSKNYYSKFPSNRKIEESKSEKLLTASLQYSQPDLKQQVKRALKRWNQLIRETLRNETGLRFSVNNVTAIISDGYPLPFREIVQKYKQPELWKLIVNRNLLEKTREGINLISDQYEEIKNAINSLDQKIPTRNELSNVQTFISEIIKLLKIKELDDQIKNLRQDILGAYYFRVPIIEIYWQVIGFFSQRYGISADALTAVVLTHELAHAYTHIGRDIDKEHWGTDAFAKTDLNIVEGLAQFYTEVLCEKLIDRFPQINESYIKLLEHQSGPYLTHKKWLENKTRIGEVIRLSLIKTRTSEVIKSDEFLEMLKQTREEIFYTDKKQKDLFE